jgi:hypothetical protein
LLTAKGGAASICTSSMRARHQLSSRVKGGPQPAKRKQGDLQTTFMAEALDHLPKRVERDR